jgi:hypothetical protein
MFKEQSNNKKVYKRYAKYKNKSTILSIRHSIHRNREIRYHPIINEIIFWIWPYYDDANKKIYILLSILYWFIVLGLLFYTLINQIMFKIVESVNLIELSATFAGFVLMSAFLDTKNYGENKDDLFRVSRTFIYSVVSFLIFYFYTPFLSNSNSYGARLIFLIVVISWVSSVFLFSAGIIGLLRIVSKNIYLKAK